MSDETETVNDQDSKIIASTLTKLTTLAEASDARAESIEKRMYKTELSQEVIMKSVGKLTESMETMVETVQQQAVSTTKFEQQLIAQEKRMMDIFDSHGKSVEKLTEKFDHMEGRVLLLEMENISNNGKADAENKAKKWWSDNWFKILQTLIIVITATAVVMNLVNTGGSKP